LNGSLSFLIDHEIGIEVKELALVQNFGLMVEYTNFDDKLFHVIVEMLIAVEVSGLSFF